jgi:hypothetical protein
MKAGIAVLLIAVATATVAHAQSNIYFGENVSPWPTSGPNDVPTPTNLVATFQAASHFYSRLPGAFTETFETFTNGTMPPALTFGTNSATLSGVYSIYSYQTPTSSVSGGFAFSGTNILGLAGGQGQFFTLTFSSPQSAFGFFGADVELNELRLTFVASNGSRRDVTVPVTRPQGSGGAFFFGFIDKTNPFVAIEFRNIGSSSDGFDLDDLTVATPDQVRPEPAILDLGLEGLSPRVGVTGTVGATYRLECAEVLTSTNWITLTNLVLPSSPFFYFDPESVAQHATRFYRAVGFQ